MRWTKKSDFVDENELPPPDVTFGVTSAMDLARKKLERAAGTSVPVLLQGESGTGKDIFARMLHVRSARSGKPLVKVTCPAIPQQLIESELFGYEKGAFTGAYDTKRGRVELAHMGSLFLDEVGSLDIAAQAKLLQVAQDGTFMRVGAHDVKQIDTRLICAANEDLRHQTEAGNFRADLFFRISAMTIDLPPLRNRVADLPVLIDYFLDRYAHAYQASPRPLSREILNLMDRYNWPGNIRQLENMVRSYVLMGNEDALIAELVPVARTNIVPEIDLANPVSLKMITKAAVQDLERQIILKALQANGWSRQKTARWLNISYRSLLYKLQEADVGQLATRRRKPQPAGFPLETGKAPSDQAGD